MNEFEHVTYLHDKVRFGDARHDLRWEVFSQVFVRACSKANLVVDAGAEFGFYIHLVRQTNPQCRVLAFEPEPPRHDALKRFFADVDGVEIRPQALMDRSGSIRIYKTEGRSASVDQHLSQWNVSEKREIEVPAVALDEALGDMVPDIVKMDIEGAEVFALEGMTRLLASGRPVIFLEFHRKFIESMLPGGAQRMSATLARFGYRIYDHTGRATEFPASRVIVATPERAAQLEFDAPVAVNRGDRQLGFSHDFSRWFNAVQGLRARACRVVLYGNSSIGKTIRALIPECVVAVVDQAATCATDGLSGVHSPTDISRFDYDFILICVLGRESLIYDELVNIYKIDASKIRGFCIEGDFAFVIK